MKKFDKESDKLLWEMKMMKKVFWIFCCPLIAIIAVAVIVLGYDANSEIENNAPWIGMVIIICGMSTFWGWSEMEDDIVAKKVEYEMSLAREYSRPKKTVGKEMRHEIEI
jgi:hypothetical protein